MRVSATLSGQPTRNPTWLPRGESAHSRNPSFGDYGYRHGAAVLRRCIATTGVSQFSPRYKQPHVRKKQNMTVSRRRESSGLAILCLTAATLALVFAGCAQAATPEPDARSGPTSTQARQPAQEPTFPAGAQDTDGRTPTIPALTPSQKATEQPEATTVAEPTQEATERPEATTVASPPQSSSIPFGQVSAGPFHTCGLRADGTIACWGAHGDEERLTESTGLLDSPPGSFSQIDA